AGNWKLSWTIARNRQPRDVGLERRRSNRRQSKIHKNQRGRHLQAYPQPVDTAHAATTTWRAKNSQDDELPVAEDHASFTRGYPAVTIDAEYQECEPGLDAMTSAEFLKQTI